MRKKQRRQWQAKKNNEHPMMQGGDSQRGNMQPLDDTPQMSPDFSYLFDQTAQEGLEYELNQEQIHADRIRRVEQVTAEFPSLRNEELFSYFEQQSSAPEGDVLYDGMEEAPDMRDYASQQDEQRYHTIPILNDDSNPFSIHSQGVHESIEEAYEEIDDSEETLAEWDDEIDYGEEPSVYDEEQYLFNQDNPYHVPEDAIEPIESDVSLYEEDDEVFDYDGYDEIGAFGENASDAAELTEEEAYWSGPVNTEPVPDPIPGEGFVKATVGYPKNVEPLVSAPDDSFVMPEMYDDDEYADEAVEFTQQEDAVLHSHSFDDEDTNLYSSSVVGARETLEPVAAYEDDGTYETENAGAVYDETEDFADVQADMYIDQPDNFKAQADDEQYPEDAAEMWIQEPDGDIPDMPSNTENETSPDFLQESPEIVTFPSLEQDPRRNRPRLSALDGLTRYLSDDDADVSPKFYEDDDFDEQAAEMSEAGEEPEREFDPDDLPSRKFFGGDRSRPQTREELNDLKAHIYHSDIGFRKYHITIANLFDALSVERKLYVKYHPRRESPRDAGGTAALLRGPRPIGEADAADRGAPVGRHSAKAPVKATRVEDRRGELADAKDDFGEYTDPSDASKIRTELRRDIRMSEKTFLFTGIIALVSLFFTSAETLGIMLPSFMRVSGSTTGFLIVNTLLLLGAVFLNLDAIVESIKRLSTFTFDSDTAVSVAAAFCLIQNIVMLFNVQPLAEGNVHIYSAIACMGLALYAAGKLLMHKRTQQNFKFVASSKPKKAVRIVADPEYSRQVAGEITNGEPVIAYQTGTGFLNGFLKLSYAIDPSEKSSHTLAPVLMIASVAVGLAVGIIQGGVAEGLAAATAALCASIPTVNMLCINLPLYRMSKRLLKEGVLLTSSASVQEYNDVNSVMLDATELFPEGSVLLHGVKKFCDQSVERVMNEVSAVVCSLDGPLKEMFLKGMKDGVDLALVEGQVEYTGRLGFGAFIDGLPVFVGTADWIRRQGISLPERELTEKYSMGGRELLYYAKGNQLMAFFALSHMPDKPIVQAMIQYEQAGGSFVIRSTDPFISERTVSDWFGVGNRSVRILTTELGAYYSEIMKGAERRSPAFLATTGRLSSFFRAINACVRAKLNFTLAVMLQAAAMVLGVVLVALFSLVSGVSGLSVVNVLIFLLFWLFAALVAPNIRKT